MKFLPSSIAIASFLIIILNFNIYNVHSENNVITGIAEKFHDDSLPAAAYRESFNINNNIAAHATNENSLSSSSSSSTFLPLSHTRNNSDADDETLDVLLADADVEKLKNDKHATDAKQRKRSSFLPPSSPSAFNFQGASNRNFFREMLSRNIDGNLENENTLDSSFVSFRTNRKQSEIHSGMPLRYTREVQVKQGRLVGIVREMSPQSRLKNVDQFLGIPYAEAPVDSRRFMPPSSPLPWQGVKYANKLENVCPQKLPNLADASGYNKGRYDQIKRILPFLKSESEDCLYLNLYVTNYGKYFYGPKVNTSFFDLIARNISYFNISINAKLKYQFRTNVELTNSKFSLSLLFLLFLLSFSRLFLALLRSCAGNQNDV